MTKNKKKCIACSYTKITLMNEMKLTYVSRFTRFNIPTRFRSTHPYHEDIKSLNMAKMKQTITEEENIKYCLLLQRKKKGERKKRLVCALI